MSLSDEQIDRYSRQIIVPGIGGVAQERLLAAKLILAGAPIDVEAVLPYLAGAGVGTIALECAAAERLIASMRTLNPDVTVLAGAAQLANPDLVTILIGSRDTCALAARLAAAHGGARLTAIARLDSPATLALLGTSRPPCPRCADGGALLRPFSTRASNAAFIAMLAEAESVKALASPHLRAPALIEFDGYRTRERKLRPPSPHCACAGKRPPSDDSPRKPKTRRPSR